MKGLFHIRARSGLRWEMGGDVSDEVMGQINSLGHPRKLTSEDVLVRYVDLVNDKPWIDKIHRFRSRAVEAMAPMMRGVPVMLDHPEGAIGREAIPVARTFNGSVVRDEDGTTWNRAAWYALANERGQALVEDVDGGIISEGSVGIFFKGLDCSVCGKEVDRYDGPTCKHRPLQKYEGRMCEWLADKPEFIDEWSFVYAGRIEGTHFHVAARDEVAAVDVAELSQRFLVEPEPAPRRLFSGGRERLRAWFKGGAAA